MLVWPRPRSRPEGGVCGYLDAEERKGSYHTQLGPIISAIECIIWKKMSSSIESPCFLASPSRSACTHDAARCAAPVDGERQRRADARRRRRAARAVAREHRATRRRLGGARRLLVLLLVVLAAAAPIAAAGALRVRPRRVPLGQGDVRDDRGPRGRRRRARAARRGGRAKYQNNSTSEQHPPRRIPQVGVVRAEAVWPSSSALTPSCTAPRVATIALFAAPQRDRRPYTRGGAALVFPPAPVE